MIPGYTSYLELPRIASRTPEKTAHLLLEFQLLLYGGKWLIARIASAVCGFMRGLKMRRQGIVMEDEMMAYVPLAEGYTCRCDLCERMQYAAGTDCEYRNHWIGNARKDVGCMSLDESSIDIRYSHGEIIDPAAPESHGVRHSNLEDLGCT